MMVMQLPKVVLKAGKSETVAVSIGSNAEGQIWSVREARKALEKARKYWNTLDLPYGVVNVPDEMVQAQLDAAIRNIYQAREIKNGLPSCTSRPLRLKMTGSDRASEIHLHHQGTKRARTK